MSWRRSTGSGSSSSSPDLRLKEGLPVTKLPDVSSGRPETAEWAQGLLRTAARSIAAASTEAGDHERWLTHRVLALGGPSARRCPPPLLEHLPGHAVRERLRLPRRGVLAGPAGDRRGAGDLPRPAATGRGARARAAQEPGRPARERHPAAGTGDPPGGGGFGRLVPAPEGTRSGSRPSGWPTSTRRPRPPSRPGSTRSSAPRWRRRSRTCSPCSTTGTGPRPRPGSASASTRRRGRLPSWWTCTPRATS